MSEKYPDDITCAFDYSDFVTRDNTSQLGDLVFPEACYMSAEKRLMFVLLKDVIDKIKKRGVLDACDLEWLKSDREDHVFSFMRLCEVFQLDPGAVRKVLHAKIAAGKQRIRPKLHLVVVSSPGDSHPFQYANHCKECKYRYDKAYKKTFYGKKSAPVVPLGDELLKAVGTR